MVAPLAAYVPAVRTGNLVYTAGQLPMVAGELPVTGKVGAEVTPEVGKAMARVCALNALAAVHSLVGIDNVTRGRQGRRVRGPRRDSMASPASSTAPPSCSARCSARRARARSAVGVSELPLDAPVEVELIVEVK